jgi:hypothetical protein
MGEFVHVTFSAISKRIFTGKFRGWYLLVLHSLTSALLGALLLISGGSLFFSVLFLMVPMMDLLGYMIWKRVHPRIGRAALFIWSYVSFAASPFGLAWVFEPQLEGDDHPR